MQKKDKVDFYRLVENAKDIIFRMRLPENAYQYISPAAAAITGYPCEEFMQPRFYWEKSSIPPGRPIAANIGRNATPVRRLTRWIIRL